MVILLVTNGVIDCSTTALLAGGEGSNPSLPLFLLIKDLFSLLFEYFC